MDFVTDSLARVLRNKYMHMKKSPLPFLKKREFFSSLS
jgi:hypothetical protein